MKVINDRIANLISELDLNPHSFAEQIGVKGAVVYNIIRGRRNKPSFDVLVKILAIYKNINTDWLLKGEGDVWNRSDVGEDGHVYDLEYRIRKLFEQLEVEMEDITALQELRILVELLVDENTFHKNKIVRLYEKNDKLMDVLREKLGIDI
ncbi:MAG: helix-turn-helix domain-containing protein [Cyclobacteriaceae bacterium]|nr:helix-turn-helix domain-containing protein [Cyclobacteriaceae bacterium]